MPLFGFIVFPNLNKGVFCHTDLPLLLQGKMSHAQLLTHLIEKQSS